MPFKWKVKFNKWPQLDNGEQLYIIGKLLAQLFEFRETISTAEMDLSIGYYQLSLINVSNDELNNFQYFAWRSICFAYHR